MAGNTKSVKVGKFIIGAASDRGLVRSSNEDYYGIFSPEASLIDSRGILIVVADGMGGHLSGAAASKCAVETLARGYFADSQKEALSASSIENRIRWAMMEANRRILEVIGEGVEGIAGTTCTAAVLLEDVAVIAHVGDSRAYLLKQGKMEQLTTDHSVVGEMVKRGTISREEADKHPSRNFITRAMGLRSKVEVDIVTVTVKPGYRIIICSDGLFTMLSEKKIATIASESDPARACKQLVKQANRQGGKDNTTVIIAERIE